MPILSNNSNNNRTLLSEKTEDMWLYFSFRGKSKYYGFTNDILPEIFLMTYFYCGFDCPSLPAVRSSGGRKSEGAES